MDDLSQIIRRWRKANGVKQGALAVKLGVSQAAVSRWENGLDQPSTEVYSAIRSLIGKSPVSPIGIEQQIISKLPGMRALVDLDGMRLLGTSQAFKAVWSELVAAEGQMLADHLIGLSQDLFIDQSIANSIRRNEIAMIAAVSDRHLNGFGDHAFRHYWAATYRKVGSRYLAEISFEACEPDAELGLRHILRVDEIG
jgi:transcriptional regulator with XRE-family HTH domain